MIRLTIVVVAAVVVLEIATGIIKHPPVDRNTAIEEITKQAKPEQECP